MPVNTISMTLPATPQQIEARRALARQLQEGAGDQRVRHPLQGLSNVAGRITGSVLAARADRQENARREALAKALGGYTPQGVDANMWGAVTANDPESAMKFAMEQQAATVAAQREAENWRRQQEYEYQQWLKQQELLNQREDTRTQDTRQYQSGQTAEQRAYEERLRQQQREQAIADREDWQKLSDGRLYNKRTGEVKSVSGGGIPGSDIFSGTSVEGQALNYLIGVGKLTPEQAAQIGAGKTITGPNGEIIFMTPQGIFAQPAGGGAAVPLAQPGQIPGQAPGQQQGGAPGDQSGLIQLTPGKPDKAQADAMTFADRMAGSETIIEKYGEAGLSLWDRGASEIPYIGNYMVSEDFQKLDQARRDFVNATLRRESGAVISDEEFDNANRQYFPQPGDTKEVLAQKKENRRLAIEGMQRAAGDLYKRNKGGETDNGGKSPPASTLPRPQTQEEYDALPSGTIYVDPEDSSGQLYRKP